MQPFTYTDGVLSVEDVSLAELADRFGTPLYVYSHGALTGRLRSLLAAFGEPAPLVAYSVKANPNLAVIRLLASHGAGADVVSGGELLRARAAGVDAAKITFAGVGKREDELALGLDEGIGCFNVEVDQELELLSRLACERGVRAPVALRVNPDVAGGGHEYIQTGKKVNKFGIPMRDARDLFRRAADLPGVSVRGVACHIGSQILSLDPFARALDRVGELVLQLRADGVTLEHMDVGGGLGVRYADEDPPALEDYARLISRRASDLDLKVVLEPGRTIAANAGVFLTRVLYTKETGGKRFLIADGAMNDLVRPSLYKAHHQVRPVREGTGSVAADLVGPVCETGDFLSRDGEIPDAAPGDLLAVMSAGAYGRSMSSNYNTRARAAEILIRGSEAHLIGEREEVAELFRGERIPEFLR